MILFGLVLKVNASADDRRKTLAFINPQILSIE